DLRPDPLHRRLPARRPPAGHRRDRGPGAAVLAADRDPGGDARGDPPGPADRSDGDRPHLAGPGHAGLRGRADPRLPVRGPGQVVPVVGLGAAHPERRPESAARDPARGHAGARRRPDLHQDLARRHRLAAVGELREGRSQPRPARVVHPDAARAETRVGLDDHGRGALVRLPVRRLNHRRDLLQPAWRRPARLPGRLQQGPPDPGGRRGLRGGRVRDHQQPRGSLLRPARPESSDFAMTVTPGETISPAVEGTFDARKRHRGAFRLGAGADRASRRRPKLVITACALWLGLLIVVAVFANVLPISDPSKVIGIPNVNPAWGSQFLGTDAIGRSMVARLAFGARVSFEISILVTLVAMVVGGAIGLLSAFFRGPVTFVADTIANTILSVPGLLLMLAIVVVFHPTIPVLILAIALLYLPGFMRVTRATAISLIEREYVVAARSLGASQFRIIARELLPNTAVALVTYAALALPGAM